MKQKLIKQFENGTDFSICVIDMQNGTYVVTEYDFVNKKHELKGKYNDKNQALMAAKEINKSFKVLNESQLRKIIKESIKKVLNENTNDLPYLSDENKDEENTMSQEELDFRKSLSPNYDQSKLDYRGKLSNGNTLIMYRDILFEVTPKGKLIRVGG
jgi:major membrane immunogen (membrane-anchored lipoprotein)